MRPTVLLIGCGDFGKNHLRILRELESERRISLLGVAVRTEDHRKELEDQGIAATTDYHEFLEKADAVDITTPATTHYEIARSALPKAHCLVEKPLALKKEHIEDLRQRAGSRILMVGQIYRFNRVLKKIKPQAEGARCKVRFIGPGKMPDGYGALHEFNHAFDIIDYLYGYPGRPRCKESRQNKRFEEYVHLEYPERNIEIEIGWTDSPKERSLTLERDDGEIWCDLIDQEIHGNRNVRVSEKEPLREEIEGFLAAIAGKKPYPDAELALRIHRMIDEAKECMR